MWLKYGAIAAVVMLLGAHWMQDRNREKALDKARTDIAQHELTIKTQAGVNKSNLSTIDKLAADNAAWAELWNEHAGNWDAERARLVAELATERTARARDRAAATAELERILTDDIDAATWSAQPVPAAIAGWVCDRLPGCTSGAAGNEGAGPGGP